MSKLSFPALGRRALLAAGAASLLLAGCSNVIGPGDMPQIYKLVPAKQQAAAGPKAGAGLAIDFPDTPDALDTSRIVISRSPDTMDYYANSAWQDRLPSIVQRALLEGFEQSGRIDQVAFDTAGLRANYLLQTSLRDFEARYDTPDGAPTIVVRIEAKLVTNQDRIIVARMTSSQEVPATANSVDAAVDAFNRASGAAVGQIVDWALAATTMASDQAPAESPAAPMERRHHHRHHRRHH